MGDFNEGKYIRKTREKYHLYTPDEIQLIHEMARVFQGDAEGPIELPFETKEAAIRQRARLHNLRTSMLNQRDRPDDVIAAQDSRGCEISLQGSTLVIRKRESKVIAEVLRLRGRSIEDIDKEFIEEMMRKSKQLEK